MLKNLFKNKISILIFIVLVAVLVAIRAFENQLFYDPLLEYFKSNFMNLPLPKVDFLKLCFGLFFRYSLNSIISLLIIFVVFKDFAFIKFASIIYVLFFIVLIIFFILTYNFFGEDNKMLLFYIRRFLIQPLLLMLFLPGFYYQKTVK